MSLTFEDLQNDPFHREIIRLAEQQYGAPLPEHIKEMFVESATWAQVKLIQERNWVSEARRIAEAIHGGTAIASDFALFWIRLCSIVCEFYKVVRQQPQLYSAFPALEPIIQTVNNIAKKFSEDDVLFIKYLRHCNSHVHQDYILGKPEHKHGVIIDYKPPND